MALWWAISSAWAGPDCGVIPDLVDAAWSSYGDAELDGANVSLQAAEDSLGCQTAPVPTETLLELYRLDALVALSQADREAAVYSTIRAVVVDPTGVPPAEYGPQLAELHASWATRLGGATLPISVDGASAVWIDGRPLDVKATVQVIPGEHLIQWQDATGFTSHVVDVGAAYVVRGVPAAGSEIVPPPGEKPPKEPKPAKDLKPVKPPKEPKVTKVDPAAPLVTRPPGEKSQVKSAVLIGSGLAALAGGATLAYAWTSERDFLANPYASPDYSGCTVTDACYADARADRIRSDAGQVRALYGIGYGLVGLGIVGIGVDVTLLADPIQKSGGAMVTVPW